MLTTNDYQRKSSTIKPKVTKNGIFPYFYATISAFLRFLIGPSLADMLSPIVKPYDKNEK